jgi:hypothetical protein
VEVISRCRGVEKWIYGRQVLEFPQRGAQGIESGAAIGHLSAE